MPDFENFSVFVCDAYAGVRIKSFRRFLLLYFLFRLVSLLDYCDADYLYDCDDYEDDCYDYY